MNESSRPAAQILRESSVPFFFVEKGPAARATDAPQP